MDRLKSEIGAKLKFILIWCIILIFIFIFFNPSMVQKTANDTSICGNNTQCKTNVKAISDMKNDNVKVCGNCSLSGGWLIFYTILLGIVVPIILLGIKLVVSKDSGSGGDR